MDRKAIIVVAACVVGIVLWTFVITPGMPGFTRLCPRKRHEQYRVGGILSSGAHGMAMCRPV